MFEQGVAPTRVVTVAGQHQIGFSVASPLVCGWDRGVGFDRARWQRFRRAVRSTWGGGARWSDLQAFGPVLDREWTRSLRAELCWLAALVGAVRYTDVLTERFRTLPAQDTEATAALLTRLAAQGDTARTAMLAALRDHRYDTLVRPARDRRRTPGTHRPRPCRSTTSSPTSPASSGEGHRAWSTHWPSRRPTPSCTASASWPSGGAGATTPGIDKPTARLAAALADLQTVLGDHHDAIVAETWLRDDATARPDTALAAGELIAAQRAENIRLRAAWPTTWRTAKARRHHWRPRSAGPGQRAPAG